MTNKTLKEKIALVTVRYGINIGGGAETLIRNYAEILTQKYNVDVITTKATDHVTWKDEIEADEEKINGVRVVRFGVDKERNMDSEFFNLLNEVHANMNNIELGEKFMVEQGPYSTKMLDYLRQHKDEYKYVIYCPYLYATTYFGSQITNKSSNVIIPAAHDEPFLYFKLMGNIFKSSSKVIFLTEEERDLVNKIYPGNYEKAVIGMGIEIKEPISNFRKKFKIKGDYFVYVGRIEEGKGTVELLDFFTRYKEKYNNKLKLVLVGKSIMPLPKRDDIIHLGYLSEEEKIAAIKESLFLVLSSQFESFSIVTLEAMLAGKAVLLNGRCEVLKGHCLKSNAGLWYTNYEEFELALDYLVDNAHEREKMGKNGQNYVLQNYQPNVIVKKLLEFLN